MNSKESTPRNLRQEQAAETRNKLLVTAKALFAEKGYHGTSVRNINQALNMANGILYHYFPGGKREILSVLLKESFEKMIEELNEYNSDIETLPLDEALNKIYMLGNEMFTSDMDLIKILSRESDLMDLKETEQLSILFTERRKWLKEFLYRRHEKGEIRDMDFDLASKQFMAISIMNIVSKILKIDLIGETSADVYREKVINYTLDLWKNP